MTWDTKYISQYGRCFVVLCYYFIEHVNNTIADIHGQRALQNT